MWGYHTSQQNLSENQRPTRCGGYLLGVSLQTTFGGGVIFEGQKRVCQLTKKISVMTTAPTIAFAVCIVLVVVLPAHVAAESASSANAGILELPECDRVRNRKARDILTEVCYAIAVFLTPNNITIKLMIVLS